MKESSVKTHLLHCYITDALNLQAWNEATENDAKFIAKVRSEFPLIFDLALLDTLVLLRDNAGISKNDELYFERLQNLYPDEAAAIEGKHFHTEFYRSDEGREFACSLSAE